MSFGSELAAFRNLVAERHVKVKRMAAFDLLSAITLATPVDFGVLRGNWFAEIGRPGLETTDVPDRTGQATLARAQQKLQATVADKDVYFTNNLPYGPRIEFDGWSGQAPEGMVRVNAMRWPSIVRRVTRRVRNER